MKSSILKTQVVQILSGDIFKVNGVEYKMTSAGNDVKRECYVKTLDGKWVTFKYDQECEC